MHSTFWLGIERRPNWRQSVVPDETGIYMSHVPEIDGRNMSWSIAPVSGSSVIGIRIGDDFPGAMGATEFHRSIRNLRYNTLSYDWLPESITCEGLTLATGRYR